MKVIFQGCMTQVKPNQVSVRLCSMVLRFSHVIMVLKKAPTQKKNVIIIKEHFGTEVFFYTSS